MTDVALPPLVVTGASGFVGRRLVAALRDRALRVVPGAPTREVTLLSREPASLAPLAPLPPHWRVVAVDLATADIPADAIPAASVVLHLAAATGRMSAAMMRRVNVEGTRRIAEGARAASASHLVFVSSIAAGFANRRWYHYAEAKRDAERVVAACGVPFTIVRPTMVFGPGSPVQDGLERIAGAPLPVVPGSGAVRVQPIHVDDVVDFLLALTASPPPSGTTLELGGGDRCTLNELLARMRAARGLPPRTPFPIPLAPVRAALAAAEVVLGARLPVTAGQLASFVNDSDAAPHPRVADYLPTPRALTAMLGGASAETVAAAGAGERPGHVTASTPLASPAGEPLAAEFAVFARYLGTRTPPPRAVAAYLRAHASVGESGDRFDAWLVGFARRSAMACGLADSYARLVRPYGTLRRKLTLVLAVLESTPATHSDYDTPRPSTAAVAWLAMVALGTMWTFRTACAVACLAPLHLAARLAAVGSSRG